MKRLTRKEKGNQHIQCSCTVCKKGFTPGWGGEVLKSRSNGFRSRKLKLQKTNFHRLSFGLVILIGPFQKIRKFDFQKAQMQHFADFAESQGFVPLVTLTD